MFNGLAKSILEPTLQEIGDILKDKWYKFVDEWYKSYSPLVYERTMESLMSITNFGVTKRGKLYSVAIGYDLNKIHTYNNITSYHKTTGLPYTYTQHSDIYMQPEWVEYGFSMKNGEREGAHAYDELIKEINSGKVLKEFKQPRS